jgi:hypothetical protein
MIHDEFPRLIYDDSDLTEAEMMAAAAQGLSDLEGWDGQIMEHYDRDDSAPA